MSRRKNPVLERIEYAVYRAVAAAVRSASPERAAAWGSAIGALGSKVLRKRDRLGMRNLALVFPEKSESERRAILDASWRHFGREMLAFVRAQTVPREEIARICTLVNAALVEEGRARGKGVMLLSGHFGGWEIGGLAIMALLDDVTTVARPLDNTLLERDLAEARERTGAAVVDRKRAARSLLRTLSNNGVVALLPDQAVQQREGVLVPFLGHDAWTTDAPAKMAARVGSTIVFAFCIPDGAVHRLEFEEPIRVSELSEADRAPEALTARINEVIARRIRQRPDLYLWMHDRWKGTGGR